MDCFIKKEYWINRQVQIYKKTPDAEVIRPWIWRFLNKRTSNRYNLLINTDKKQANQMNFYQKYFTSCFNPRRIQQVCQTTHFKALAFHDPAQALEILDPDKTRSRGFYIPDNATPKLREIRAAKKQIEEQLHHAQTDAEKEELRSRRTRVCAEEDSEEMKVRRSMGAALAPMADDLLAKNPKVHSPKMSACRLMPTRRTMRR